MMVKHKQAKPYSLGAIQAQGNAYCKRPLTLPSLESKRRFDIETFNHECPRCKKQEKHCDLCGGRTWFIVEEVLTIQKE
jgi:hypothetical protein